ncbi:MAG TPA: lysophospholipid acyltransferase family protein [Caldimonas sp.]|nr:lysophospholipid acyltransferase family protein [Caldimonas sp.]
MRLLAWLRSALFVAWMVVTVIPWGIGILVMSVFVHGAPLYWACVGWLRIALWGCRTICGVRMRLHGFEHLPEHSVIVLSKHQSTWETFALPTLMPHPLCYVFKRELLFIPFFGWAMARLDMVHIDRSRRAEAWAKVAEQGRRYMSMGNWVIMFPEGTRTPRGSQGTYKSGGTRLAVATERPVLPVAVTSGRCWPRKRFVLTPGVIDVSVGRPIPSIGRQPDELMREVEAWIEAEMRRLDPDAYAVAGGEVALAP